MARARTGPFSPSAHAVDEALVDLEHVQREALQMGERRVAGAEVVDGEPHAQRLELGESRERGAGVLHRRALGDLEHQRPRRDPGGVEGGADVRDELRRVGCPVQLPAGDVDGHVRRGVRAVDPLPVPQLAARLAEHPPAERHDQAGVLGRRDERPGPQHAALGVMPPHQRLEAGERAGVELHDRLVHEGELPPVHGAAQVRLELQTYAGSRVQRRLEQREAALAIRLRLVHRRVGVAEERLRRGHGRRARRRGRDRDPPRSPSRAPRCRPRRTDRRRPP
jgi:hypothetical protein